MLWLYRFLYSFLVMLLTPLMLARLWMRGKKEPEYRLHMLQRLGFYGAQPSSKNAVWLHAVSLGEMRTAGMLIAKWRERDPQLKLLLTCSTATGWQEAQKLRNEHTQMVWLPWDTPGAVRRFLRHFAPRTGLLMETEVWPNLMAQADKDGLPVWLINARLSEKSLHKALKLRQLSQAAYARLKGVLAQTQNDAFRLQEAGAPVRAVVGNIKFDIELNQQQIEDAAQIQHRWNSSENTQNIITLASSREGEEKQFLQAWAELKTLGLTPGCIPMIVPRHPQRFDAVYQMASAAGFEVITREHFAQMPLNAQKNMLLLGNSMGEMQFYYALSHQVLMGGSFEPLGGQNLIEALAVGRPVIVGPHTFNFAQATEDALAAGLACRAPDLQGALQQALQTISQHGDDLSRFKEDRAMEYFANNRGAIQKTLDFLQS